MVSTDRQADAESASEREVLRESLQHDSESTVSALAAGLAAANPETKKSESEATAKAEESASGEPTEGAQAGSGQPAPEGSEAGG